MSEMASGREAHAHVACDSLWDVGVPEENEFGA